MSHQPKKREVPSYLAGHASVVAAFGYWPSFHDAPVLHFNQTSAFIELSIETWEMSSEVDPHGYFVLTKRHQIGFRFSEIVTTELSAFIPENILSELSFSSLADFDANGQFLVKLDSAMGSDLEGAFTAKNGEVTFVRPCQEQAEL